MTSTTETQDALSAAHHNFGGELARTQIKGATIAGQLCDVSITFAGSLLVSTKPGLCHSSGDLTRFLRMSLDLPSAPPAAANDNDPVDLWAEREKPSLPTGLLPDAIEKFARASGNQMGVDPGGLAVAALTVCASAIPDSIRLQVKRHDPNWNESARLWSCVVGGPSTKKTPLLSAALVPLRAIDNVLARDFSAKAAAFVRLEKRVQTDSERPKNVRALLEDTTMEAAQEVLKDSESGLLLHRDELAGFFGSMDKYSGGKGSAADRAFWLQTFNGGPYSVNRVGRGPVFIPNLSVSLLGGIQPEPMREIANGMTDDGLLQRMLPIVLGSAGVDRDEPTTGEVIEYGALVRRLHALKPAASEGAIPFNINLRFEEDAQLVRERFAAKHHQMVAAWEEINRKLASHIGKYDSFFNRLCVTFHCIESSRDRPVATITADTAERVGAFLHAFLWPHALAFYSSVLGLADNHDALAASAGWILAKRPVEVTARDIQRGDRTMQKLSSEGAEDVLTRLDAFGWLDAIETRGNQTAKRYRVRASVFTQFEDRAEVEAIRRAKIRAAIAENATMH